jgi:hypothetical protein
MYLPPGFDARKFPHPRATKEAFASLRLFFSQPPFAKGAEGISEETLQNGKVAFFKERKGYGIRSRVSRN